MKKNSNVSTNRKSAKAKDVVNAVSTQQVINTTKAAVEGVGNHKVRQTAESQFNAAVIRESLEDLKIREFSSKVLSRWASADFERSSDYVTICDAVSSLPADVKERMLKAAKSAWLSRPENSGVSVTLSELVSVLSTEYANEFVTLCGCSVPSVSDVRLYSRTALSVNTVTYDSKVTDYVTSTKIQTKDVSNSYLLSAVLSVRFLADIKSRIANALSNARKDLYNDVENIVRRASRMGVETGVISRYISLKFRSVVALDNKERERLEKNLVNTWASLRTIENNLVLAGAVNYLQDVDGGYVFNKTLDGIKPDKCPAKTAKRLARLWDDRKSTISSINTINGLLARC